MKFGHIRNIHFVGIGGIGMSGIAEILSNYEFEISGCDLATSTTTARLADRGIPVVEGHDPAHLDGVDLLVISSAVRRENREVAGAAEQRIPVIRRAEMLGEIMRLKRGIGVAGTHGKTTTSAMVARVLATADLDPTLIVGGVLRELSSSARLGTGEFLVVEADEYDRSFLTLHPEIAVVTNIEMDHGDIYSDVEDLRQTFVEFLSRVPFYGVVVGCTDDSRVREILGSLSRRSVGYGFEEGSEVRAGDLVREGEQTSFSVFRGKENLGRMVLRVPGRHNVLNALAAVAVGLELDIPIDVIAEGISAYRGVERRFQIVGQWRDVIVVDDYAHHPTEIRATIEAARGSYGDHRIVAVFQPHLYSRTRDFHEEFAEALALADVAWVAPVYPAREEPIDGVDSSLITSAAERRGGENVKLLDADFDGIVDHLRASLEAPAVLITMGAGNIHEVAERLVEEGR
jgi:UDP-N-acetylmuramate--alanine ligase